MYTTHARTHAPHTYTRTHAHAYAYACMEIIAIAKLIRTVNFDEVYIKSENFASKI